MIEGNFIDGYRGNILVVVCVTLEEQLIWNQEVCSAMKREVVLDIISIMATLFLP